MEQDNELKKILSEINNNSKVESFSRKYFEQNDFQTPQNTPSAKNGPQISLKTLDFTKYINNQNFDEDSPEKNEYDYCEPTFIGKIGLQLNLDNSNKNKKICINILCTKCDVKVSSFKNKKWSDTSDYLFFRNNYGNETKLKEKLLTANNCVSYSCQCSWTTVQDEIKNVEDIPGIDWTCGGHRN